MPESRIDSPNAAPASDVRSLLANLYSEKAQPLEEKFSFCNGRLPASTFHSSPLVLIIGPYSSGKTSLVKYILQEEYPVMNIGPQPTTDGFDVYAFGETGTTLQGNIALSSAKYPFQPFIRYGDAFINKFRIHELPNDTLKGTVIIDTPGILSGAKQLERGYPFDKVICDLAEISLTIVILLEINKIDISEELEQLIKPINKKFGHKVIFAVNKSHLMTIESAIDILPSMAWQLRMAIDNPEKPKFYICSFILSALPESPLSSIIKKNMSDFRAKFDNISTTNLLSTMNIFLQRVKNIKAYFYLINAIRDKLSIWKSTETQKKKLLDEVEQLISTVANENNIHESEFPDTDSIKENIRRRPLSAFVTVKAKYFNEIKALEDNISAMIAKASIKTKDSGLNYQSKKDDNPFLNQEEEYSNIITPNLVERIKTEFLNISGAFDKDIKISEFTELMIKRAGVNREVLAKAWDIAFKEEKKVISFIDYGTMVFLVELVNNDINMPNTIPQSWKLILSS